MVCSYFLQIKHSFQGESPQITGQLEDSDRTRKSSPQACVSTVSNSLGGGDSSVEPPASWTGISSDPASSKLSFILGVGDFSNSVEPSMLL